MSLLSLCRYNLCSPLACCSKCKELVTNTRLQVL
uniref:Uncharacterized protein n=1 Tax=Anguilla anguilla TaxID=7936 RepID=A0A0E9V626_ANGAN